MGPWLLDGAWEFKHADSTTWMPAEVPGDVMTDLIRNGQLDDPYHGTNERKSQWVESADWVYRHVFKNPSKARESSEFIKLVFNGLDTYSTIILNGDTILQTNNAHRTWIASVSDHLKEQNVLEVHFHSPVKMGQEQLDASPWFIPVSNEQRPQGEQTSSVSRKAMYQYGWDWGPRLTSAGIWQDVFLRVTDDIQLMRLNLQGLTPEQASYQVEVEGPVNDIAWDLTGPNGDRVVFDITSTSVGTWNLHIPNPKLWWPNGMGEQPLYTLEARSGMQSVTKRFGIRTITWNRDKDALGRRFECVVNGQPIFARGANMVPPDFFPVRARNQTARLIDDAIAANMNMLRIWGGAIYGEDAFYDLCDERGLLVWQDFMFACCMVPEDSAYVANVTAEAFEQVQRIRHHPSLALWCGNNESEKAWETWGWQETYGLSPTDSASVHQAYLRIFDEVLPLAVAEESDAFYWASSPMTDPLENRPDKLSGDEHAWRVWFDTLDFDHYSDHLGRFASEYGLQSLPDRKTLEAAGIHAFDDEALQFRQRSAMEWLEPGLDGWGMMRIYARRYTADPAQEAGQLNALDRWIYLTQLTQAEGLREAIERHRFSRGRTAGSLYWQLDDVWPAVSWSTVDFDGRWKLAHYAVQHANAPRRVLFDRMDSDSLRLLLDNSGPLATEGRLQLTSVDLHGTKQRTDSIHLACKPFEAFEWNAGAFSDWAPDPTTHLLVWIWTSDNGTLIDQGIQRLAKPSEIAWPKAKIEITVNGSEITVRSDAFTYGVQVRTEHAGHLSDNGFTLLPGQSRVIHFDGESPGKVEATCLADFQ